MCDYSLNFVASRPAKVGDKLVSTRFDNSLTRGFAAVEEPSVAVCIRPGTEIAFEKEVECVNGLGILPNLKLGETLARFRQLNMNKPNMHHDALEFPSGKIVLLHKLYEGQRATILQLPVVSQMVSPASEAEVQKRGAIGA